MSGTPKPVAVLDVAGNPLEPGKWYAIGFERDDQTIDYGPILRYEGPRDWYDESGDIVESLFDPMLQYPVAMDAADAYQVQA